MLPIFLFRCDNKNLGLSPMCSVGRDNVVNPPIWGEQTMADYLATWWVHSGIKDTEQNFFGIWVQPVFWRTIRACINFSGPRALAVVTEVEENQPILIEVIWVWILLETGLYCFSFVFLEFVKKFVNGIQIRCSWNSMHLFPRYLLVRFSKN